MASSSWGGALPLCHSCGLTHIFELLKRDATQIWNVGIAALLLFIITLEQKELKSSKKGVSRALGSKHGLLQRSEKFVFSDVHLPITIDILVSMPINSKMLLRAVCLLKLPRLMIAKHLEKEIFFLAFHGKIWTRSDWKSVVRCLK